MSTLEYAKRELDLLCKYYNDPENRPLVEEFIPEMLELIKKFGDSGQSGGSAPYVSRAITDTLQKLMMFQPILPITGINEEWTFHDYGLNSSYQNNRLSSLFKSTKEGPVKYIYAIIWENDTGIRYSGSTLIAEPDIRVSSQQIIKGFPFEPKTFYIKVREVETKSDDWEFYLDDVSQLKEVAEYYDLQPEVLQLLKE